MDQTPKLVKYDRRTIAAMNAINRVLDRLAGYSVAGGGLSALGTLLAGQKVNLLLPIVSAMIGATSLAIRELLTYLVSVAEIDNPIPVITSSVPLVELPKPDVDPPTVT